MNRRSMLYTALAALGTIFAAGCASQARVSPGAVAEGKGCCCCCCDEKCVPGCCEECPPDCCPGGTQDCCKAGCCDAHQGQAKS